MLSAPASSHIDFAGSPRPTLGVEWEFALVDAETRDVSNEAAEVIEELGENNPHVHKELLRNTVEIVTGICDSVPQAMDDLRSTLVTARKIVHGRGMGHGGMLNFGDAFAYALAKSLDAPLLFVGDDFGATDVVPALRGDRA